MGRIRKQEELLRRLKLASCELKRLATRIQNDLLDPNKVSTEIKNVYNRLYDPKAKNMRIYTDDELIHKLNRRLLKRSLTVEF